MRISDWSSDVCSSDLREVIGAEPVLPNDDRVTGNRTHLFHEAREMEGDLRIGRLIVGLSWSDRLCLSEAVGLYDPGDDGAAGGLKDTGGGEPGREDKRPDSSEERRGGQEGGRTGRTQWAA